MIATISFSSIAEWVVGAYVAGVLSGIAISLWVAFRSKKK